ncbi:MAG TPA: DUF3572 domain-containing protein [Rhizomicrobium sp.]|jgi:hypothetical protein|nr:DUF3572 domain-containing protein [Rhizomicrobium sp.]
MAEMKSPQTRENAEILALEGLGWLAGQEEGLRRFLDQSGMDASGLRLAAGRPEMGMAVLDFLLANEDLLLGFCESAAVAPQALHLARHRLDGAR